MRVCGVGSPSYSATFAAISRSLNASSDQVFGNLFSVSGQTEEAHKVDEGSGEVDLAAKLACGVVKGKCVMVVVEALPCEKKILHIIY